MQGISKMSHCQFIEHNSIRLPNENKSNNQILVVKCIPNLINKTTLLKKYDGFLQIYEYINIKM